MTTPTMTDPVDLRYEEISTLTGQPKAQNAMAKADCLTCTVAKPAAIGGALGALAGLLFGVSPLLLGAAGATAGAGVALARR